MVALVLIVLLEGDLAVVSQMPSGNVTISSGLPQQTV